MAGELNMAKTLVLLHGAEAFPKAAFETLGAAAATGPFELASVGLAPDAFAGCGAERFLTVDGEPFRHSRAATDIAAAEALIKASAAGIILAPHTPRWQRALPAVAEKLGAAIDTHIVAWNGAEATRWLYRQRLEARFTREQRPWILLLEPGAFPALECNAAPVAVERLEPEFSTRTTVEGLAATAAGEQTIRPDAELLLVAGAGWTKKQRDGQTHTAEASELIQALLAKSKASLGSSKSLVDLGGEGQAVLPFLTHLHQVGQTGSTPRHKKGLATCCHGEEPHAVGWRFISERRAINLDANCGWARGKADVLYVADAFEVTRELLKLL